MRYDVAGYFLVICVYLRSRTHDTRTIKHTFENRSCGRDIVVIWCNSPFSVFCAFPTKAKQTKYITDQQQIYTAEAGSKVPTRRTIYIYDTTNTQHNLTDVTCTVAGRPRRARVIKKQATRNKGSLKS